MPSKNQIGMSLIMYGEKLADINNPLFEFLELGSVYDLLYFPYIILLISKFETCLKRVAFMKLLLSSFSNYVNKIWKKKRSKGSKKKLSSVFHGS